MSVPEPVFFIGFSGAGKSSVGKALARSLRARFYDTDEMVIRKAGMSIADIFRFDGQASFRRLERDVIGGLINRLPGSAVVALGGGAFLNSENRKLVMTSGTVIYLSCSQRELYRRLRQMTDRPLLLTDESKSEAASRILKSRIASMLKKRVRYYELADLRQSTTGRTVKDTVRELRRKLSRYYAKN
ncbi:MAG: shikimate kinase [Candidatus Zixiibacteriota bacterium]|nr:MAG: shikimate kinase [candidate division Zixibacteria bacterium]